MAIDSTLRGIRLSIDRETDPGEKPEVVFGLTDAGDQSWTLARFAATEQGSFGGRLALEVSAGGDSSRNTTTERLSIDSAGNVGIGSALSVGGTLQAGEIADVAAEITALKGRTFTAAEVGALAIGGGTLGGDLRVNGILDAGDIRINGAPLALSPWEAVSGGINYAGGNVGIGTTTPEENVDVAGRIKTGALSIGPWPANPSQYMFFGTNALDQSQAGNYTLLQGASGGDSGRTFLNSPVDIRFRIGNSDKMIVANNGNVGVGTTKPEAPLHVAEYMAVGPFSATGGQGGIDLSGPVAELGLVRRNLSAWPTSAAPGDRYVWYNPDGSAAWLWTHGLGNLFGVTKDGDVSYRRQLGKLDVSDVFSAIVRCADFNIGFSQRRGSPGRALCDLKTQLSINHDGDWPGGCVYGVSMNRASSRAIKGNIAAFSSGEALRVLHGLDSVKYTLNSDPDQTAQVGFIAEDVPELVGTADRKAVNNDHIVAVLVKVVQDQQKALTELSKSVEAVGVRA